MISQCLILFETVYEKRGIALADCEKEEFDYSAFGSFRYRLCI